MSLTPFLQQIKTVLNENFTSLQATELVSTPLNLQLISLSAKFYNRKRLIKRNCPFYKIGSFSSLHWSFFLSFYSFSYSGVCYDVLKVSVSDIIVSQKSSNGEGKLQFFWAGLQFNSRSLRKTSSLG